MKLGACQIRHVKTCSADSSVFEVAKLLRDYQQRNIVVVGGTKPLGVISVSDVNNRVVAEGKDPKQTKAVDIMTVNLIVKESTEDLTPVYLEMIRRKVYSAVIVHKEKLVGMLDLKEAMNCLVKEKKNHGKGKK